MMIKAVKMVRKIRDQHYEQTRNLSVEEQIKFIREKSNKLQKELCVSYHVEAIKTLDK